MWQILKAEIAYNRLNHLGFLLLIAPLLAYSSVRESAAPAILAWVLMFLMVNNWNAFRIREKRSLQLVQLPVAVRSVGLARFLLIVFLSGSFMLVYALLQAVFTPETATGARVILCLFGLTVSIFALGLIFRDRFVGTKALGRGKVLLVTVLGLVVFANFYFLILARRASTTGAEPPAFVRALRFAIAHNPANTAAGTAVLVTVGLALGLLSVITFARRKTHVE